MKKTIALFLMLVCVFIVTGCEGSSAPVATTPPPSGQIADNIASQIADSTLDISSQLPQAGENGVISMPDEAGGSVSFSLGMTKAQVEQILKNADISYLDGEKDLELTDNDIIFTEDLYFQFKDKLDIIYVNSDNIKTALGLKNGDSKDVIDNLYSTPDIAKLCSFTVDDQTKQYTYYQYERSGYYFWILTDNQSEIVTTWGVSTFSYPSDNEHVFTLWGSGYSSMIQKTD